MNKSLLVEKIMHPDVLKSIKKSVSRLAAKPENRGGRIPCEYCRANEKFENEHEVLEHIKSMHPIQCPGKVRSCYRVSIPSKPSSQKIFTKSKNDNKISWEMGLLSLSNLAIYIKKAEFSGFKA